MVLDGHSSNQASIPCLQQSQLGLDRSGILRKLHNEELRNSYSLPNIIRMIKSSRLKSLGEKRNAHSVLAGN
jgi:hypothetical protein